MRDAHATVFLDAAAAARVEPLRQRWDPVMADQIAAHLTVTYPTEIPSALTLRERLEAATERVGPFRLRLGEVRSFGEPDQGLFAEVIDVDGGWLALREAVGFTSKRLEVTPHVTLVHPRTSKRGLEAWTVLQGTDLDVGVAVGSGSDHCVQRTGVANRCDLPAHWTAVLTPRCRGVLDATHHRPRRSAQAQ